MAIKQFVAFTISICRLAQRFTHSQSQSHSYSLSMLIRTHDNKIVITTKASPSAAQTFSFMFICSFHNHKRLAHCIANCAHICCIYLYVFAIRYGQSGALSFQLTCYTSITIITIMRRKIRRRRIKHHFGAYPSGHIEMTMRNARKGQRRYCVDNAFFLLVLPPYDCSLRSETFASNVLSFITICSFLLSKVACIMSTIINGSTKWSIYASSYKVLGSLFYYRRN